MRQFLIVGLLLAALPLAAQQAVSVRSGAHEGFSRLVLSVDPETPWQLEESPGQAVLSFPGQNLSFLTAQVFDRISATHIADIQSQTDESGSSLELKLQCKCEVQAFGYNQNYIVVDVFDGPKLEPITQADAAQVWRPDGLPFVQPPNVPDRFFAQVMTEAPLQPRIAPASPAPTSTPEPIIAQLPAPSEPDVVTELENMAGAVVDDLNVGVTVEEDPILLARINEAQDQLLAQLARAADQGLIDFVIEPVSAAESPATEVEPVPAPDPEPEQVEIDPVLAQQLSARTAYENGTEDALAEIVNQFAKPQCLDDSAFSMAGWRDDAQFSIALAELRSNLLGEFDIADPQVAKEIVQLYLLYGLGAEARLTLSESEIDVETANIYRDMAAILDGNNAMVNGPVLKGAGCGGAHEMWYLAAGNGTNQVLEPLAIAEAFSSYPIAVRTLIGPPLASAFIARGQADAGHVVLEIVRRADGAVTPAQRLAEARVLEAQADQDAANEIYQKLATSRDALAPEAMIALAQSLLRAGQAPPASLLLDLESAAFFNRETSYADPLRLGEIRVRAKVEGADIALAQVAENIGERPHLAPDLREIAAEVFENSTAEETGDYAYAQMVLQFAALLDQGPAGDKARIKIAEEMAGLGLPESALDVLSPNLSRPNAKSSRLVAGAYIQLFEPEAAIALLADDESLEAYKIRLEANLQLEDFEAVARMLEEGHAKAISIADVASRIENWRYIEAATSAGALPTFGDDETLVGEIQDEAPSLKAARALLATNEENRIFLEEMLANTGE